VLLLNRRKIHSCLLYAGYGATGMSLKTPRTRISGISIALEVQLETLVTLWRVDFSEPGFKPG
jgi:hypothetical protein